MNQYQTPQQRQFFRQNANQVRNTNQTSGFQQGQDGNQTQDYVQNQNINQADNGGRYQHSNQAEDSVQIPGGNQNNHPQPNDSQISAAEQPQPGMPNSNQAQNQNSWMNNPALGGIDPAKLQMLTSLASQAQGKNQNELLPFLMAAASQTQSNNMSFKQDEIDTIINVMKLGKSPQEVQRMDRLLSLVKQFRGMR